MRSQLLFCLLLNEKKGNSKLTFFELRVYYEYNKIPMKLSEAQQLKAEDSLENTLSCVPKVQGESRISQAKGRRSE